MNNPEPAPSNQPTMTTDKETFCIQIPISAAIDKIKELDDEGALPWSFRLSLAKDLYILSLEPLAWIAIDLFAAKQKDLSEPEYCELVREFIASSKKRAIRIACTPAPPSTMHQGPEDLLTVAFLGIRNCDVSCCRPGDPSQMNRLWDALEEQINDYLSDGYDRYLGWFNQP